MDKNAISKHNFLTSSQKLPLPHDSSFLTGLVKLPKTLNESTEENIAKKRKNK